MYRCLVGNVDREGAVSLLRYKLTYSGMQLTTYSGVSSKPTKKPAQVCNSLSTQVQAHNLLRNLLRFSAHTLLRYKLTIH